MEHFVTSEEASEINSHASILMKRGIALVDAGDPAAFAEAEACFHDAAELRRALPFRDVPVYAYNLAACVLNLADLLARDSDPARRASALPAYDEGIALLQHLPFVDDERFPRRLAIALQNRGLALQETSVGAGIESLSGAVAVLEHDTAARIADRDALLGAVYLNLANAHAASDTEGATGRARGAALQALGAVAATESSILKAAEAGLKARHVLCRLLAHRLDTAQRSDAGFIEEVHETTDIVDEGLALARNWERTGATCFRAVAHDLFRFGARVYALYQPHFLEEFIADNMDPAQSSRDYVESQVMRAAAQEARSLLRR